MTQNIFKVLLLGAAAHVLKSIRVKEVIRLEDRDVLAAGHLKALVHRVAIAAVGLVYDLEAGVAIDIGVDDVERAVGRAVVDADDLDVLEGLHACGLQALVQVPLDVADGDEDRDKRRAGCAHANILSERGQESVSETAGFLIG